MDAYRTSPVVYLIGDSIAAGYAAQVQKELGGEAVVHLRPENGRDSRNLLTRIPYWLEGRTYDVIHFNCGLHDIKRSHGDGQIAVPIDEYEHNLYQIVYLLRRYSQRLIWARITPVVDGQPHPAKSFDRFNHDVDDYNRVADRVMAACGVPVNDLHRIVMLAGVKNCLSEDGVHMTSEGNRVLGQQVARAIRSALALPIKTTKRE
ncbi:MAG: SGNH/GDSL hydrolase family protein [Anaerolineae bacterium]